MSAILQSGSFLYVAEYGDGEGTVVPLTDYEIATRLSLLLWNTLPDETLMQAAAQGALSDTAAVLQQARRLMASDAFDRTIREFIKTMSGIPHVATVSRDEPVLDDALRAALTADADRFLDATLESDRSRPSLCRPTAAVRFERI